MRGERGRAPPAAGLPARGLAAGGLAAGLLALSACSEPAPVEVPGGNPEQGRKLLSVYGCMTCHTIPGVAGASAKIGPPLGGLGQRAYLAGRLAHTPEALRMWIMNPQEVDPGSAMPDLGVNAQEARDMAAYLYTLD